MGYSRPLYRNWILKGVDFVSGSGATALFIMDAGMQKGVKFSSVFSVGNSAQLGVEEVLEYWDESFDPETSSRIKLMYVESIDKPEKLLKHASSLIRKGCRIAAIKSGGSAAGSRAASSHTELWPARMLPWKLYSGKPVSYGVTGGMNWPRWQLFLTIPN